jgi:ubiquinone/menaquinone biosynthesis C-methylase UbiE
MWSYDRHKAMEMELAERSDLPSCYICPNSVDAWRHRRMLESTLPIVKEFPDSKWLTVGDGRFGSDAFFLQAHGIDVMATSISSHTLEIAHSRGFIPKYAAENAEAFRIPDDSVDFVLCKESLHHFPRPPVAFYEMLRIAHKGVVLIEPIEGSQKPLTALKTLAKRMVRGNASDQFESSGNFLYRISIREASKMLTALGHPCLAWKGINDFWYPPFAAADFGKSSFGALGTRLGIGFQDVLARLKLLNYGLAAVICFKQRPGMSLASRLKREGFRVLALPENPYRHAARGAEAEAPVDCSVEPPPVQSGAGASE